MAVADTWTRRDGTRSARYGKGLRYQVRYRGAPGKSFATKAAAERYWFKIRTEDPQPIRDEVMVGDLLERWLATKKGLLSPRGYRACQDAAVHVRGTWGTRPASTVRAVEVQTWIASMAGSPSLKHKVSQALSGALQIAVAEDLLDANPCVGVKVPKQVHRDPRFLTIEQLQLLADECDGYKPLVLFLGTTALRIGEACALNVGDVDKRRRRVWVRAETSKTRRGRDVPVAASVLKMLRLRRPPDAPLFTTPRGSRVLKDNWRARHFVPAVERSGLTGLHVHDLRHTAVSLAIAAGADVKVVQRMAGHASATMTLDLYAGLFDRGLDDVARRMDGLLGGGE